MAIAPKLKEYLERAGLEYRVVEHRETPSASRSAEAAHAPGDRVAKAVLLRDEKGYLLAVLPSTHQVQLEAVGRLLNRRLELASEQQMPTISMRSRSRSTSRRAMPRRATLRSIPSSSRSGWPSRPTRPSAASRSA
jgi:hypothetical protein